MAKTVLERVRAFRERLKNNPIKKEQYKMKDKLAHREQRKCKPLLSPNEKIKEREKCLKRVRIHRERKRMMEKDAKVNTEDNVYKTPQSLGKAIRKVHLALPASPRKRKVVVTKIADQHGIKKCFSNIRVSNRKISPKVKCCVENFYQLDSISRQAPGMKDCVAAKQNGKKVKLQKRHLMWPLKEVYNEFQNSNPNIKISLSKFCSLRPQNVLLSSKMPRNVCLCEKHDNIKLLCEAIHKIVPRVPLYSSDVLHTFVCDSDNENCMTGKCKNCPKWVDEAKESAPLDEEMEWFQWERVFVKIPRKKEDAPKTKKKIQKVLKEGSVEDAINSLNNKMPAFLDHVFVKRKQSQFFEKKISNLGSNEAAIQIDFSENYTCGHQDEIQAAHWDQSQVTIFPVVIWTKDGCKSYAFASDDRDHNKHSVSVFLEIVLKRVAKENPNVTHIHIFSDGPSSQFKNKYIVYLLKKLQEMCGLELNWHYFASSHGKGAVDGVGGTVKRSVWNAVATRKVPMVIDAQSFTSTANDVCNLTTEVILVTKKMISERYPVFCIQNAVTIPGISKVHCVEHEKNGAFTLKKYSSQQTKYGQTYCTDNGCDNESDDNECDYSDDDCDDCESNESDCDIPCCGDELSYVFDNADDIQMSVENVNTDTYQAKNNHLDVKFHLPEKLTEMLSSKVPYSFPPHKQTLLEAILTNDYPFEGVNLIGMNDLQELSGRGVNDRDRWLSNFIIDEYLKIISKHSSLTVKTIPWEKFEKSSVDNLSKEFNNDITTYDLVLIPCNEVSTEHWFLVAIIPEDEAIVALDSLTQPNKLKSKVKRSLRKCSDLVSALNPKLKWQLYCGQEAQVPQQRNGFDCGVFVCIFSRCLALSQPLIDPCNIPKFRLGMIVELHEKMLSMQSDNEVQVESYYAIAYEKRFFIGRLLSSDPSGLMHMKFLHSIQYKGETSFRWPQRDDIDIVHPARIVYGPLDMELNENHTFTIKSINLNSLFKSYNKQKQQQFQKK